MTARKVRVLSAILLINITVSMSIIGYAILTLSLPDALLIPLAICNGINLAIVAHHFIVKYELA